MKWVLGLGGSNHDFSSTLLENGKAHTIIEDERITGIRYGDKHWISKPCLPSSRYCLSHAALSMDEIDGLFVSNDIEGHDRFWQNHNHTIVGHHMCHASAAYYSSPFDDAAVLVIDGRGGPVGPIIDERRSFETISTGTGRGASLDLETIQSGQHYVSTSTWRYVSSNSLGWFYSIVTECVGMGNEGEGKTMALAAFGKPRYQEDLLQFITSNNEQPFQINPYGGIWSFLTDTILAAGNSFAVRADLAASAQEILEDVVVSIATQLRKQTNQKYLVYGGGVALNGVANHRIREKAGFDNLFIFPASGDNGLSAGAALYGYHHIGDNPVQDRSLSRSVSFAFGGRIYTDEDMEDEARMFSVSVQRTSNTEDLTNRIIDRLINGDIIALFQNGSEFGPRALGNRSLIALPNSQNIQRRLNEVKRRESFRPFAPIVLEEDADQYFEISAPSPFMLEIAPVRKKYRQQLAGAVHVDGSARIQTIAPYQQGIVRSLLIALKEINLPPVIVNTSFNLKGQPIVESPKDALTAFMHLNIDALVMGSLWLEKQPPLDGLNSKENML